MSKDNKNKPAGTAAENLPEEAAKALQETAATLQNLADAAEGKAAPAAEEPDDAWYF